MTGEIRTLTALLQGCGIPCMREHSTPVMAPLPRLTWSVDLTGMDAGSVILTCWYRNDDAAMLAMMDTLQQMFPVSGRILRTAEGGLLRLYPVRADFLRDAADPMIHGGRMVLHLDVFSKEEV